MEDVCLMELSPQEVHSSHVHAGQKKGMDIYQMLQFGRVLGHMNRQYLEAAEWELSLPIRMSQQVIQYLCHSRHPNPNGISVGNVTIFLSSANKASRNTLRGSKETRQVLHFTQNFRGCGLHLMECKDSGIFTPTYTR